MASAEGPVRPGGRVRALFDAAVELPLAERGRFLRDLTGADAELREEVDALLAAHDWASGLFEEPPAPRRGPSFESRDLVGHRVGDYRIVRLLGRGGMGAVFLAERADGAYDQRVAIKVIDRLDQDPQAIPRFERERQTLAKLSHPNIARLLDGGTIDDGTPFLVMEHVAGEHIDRFCDERRLDLAARLRLFGQVCAGVQHAHRHLVVHRDLKPGNILVTAEGEVKLLDFGLAKLLGELEAEKPNGATADQPLVKARARTLQLALTAAGSAVFTPGYASPEQLSGGQVSAASDVFALGTILYELLCGIHPYARQYDDMIAMFGAILQQEAPPASLLLATAVTPSEAAEIAARRRRGVPALRRELAGDLDAILLKALAKTEAQRYDSAAALALDLERHLDHQPVAARAGERAYVARRFVRRHRHAVAGALLLLLSLVAGLAATAWQAARAERAQAVAERRFEQVQELARSLMFDVHDAIARLPGATTARHLLVERALTYLDALREEAAGDRLLQLELADAYERIGDLEGHPGGANLGDTAAAVASYRAALALRLEQPEAVRMDPASKAAIARTHHKIGEVLWWTGDTGEAKRQIELAIARWKSLAETEPGEQEWPRQWAESLITAARVRSWNGENDEALERFDTAERLLAGLGGDEPSLPVALALAQIEQGRGEALGWMGEDDLALAELERARARLASLSAQQLLDAPLRRRFFLASLRHSSQLAERSPEEAIASFGETLAIAVELAAADPANALARRDLSLAHAAFGDVLTTAGNQDLALEHFRRAQAIQRRLADDDPNNLGHVSDLANSAIRIGYLLREERELEAALASFDEALGLRLPLLETDREDTGNRRDVAVLQSARGDVQVDLGARPGRDPAADRRAACAAYRESLALWRELERNGHLRPYDQPQLDHAAERAGEC